MTCSRLGPLELLTVVHLVKSEALSPVDNQIEVTELLWNHLQDEFAHLLESLVDTLLSIDIRCLSFDW